MNERKLKAKMIEYGDTQADLAKALGIHQPTFNVKLKGIKGQFTQHEIQRIADRYDLTAEEIHSIFFNHKERGAGCCPVNA